MSVKKDLDVITIGRASVDLCGAQIGGRLEDMHSFDKYIGDSPTNMAAGGFANGKSLSYLVGALRSGPKGLKNGCA